MWKDVKVRLFWWMVGVLTGIALGATLAFARNIDITKAGVSLWIFLVVGACIILLQAVPAVIIIMSLVAHLHKRVPVTNTVKDIPEKECC